MVFGVAVSFIGGGNASIWRKTIDLSQTDKFNHIMCTSPRTRFELSNLVLIGTDCTGSCNSNHHTITTTTAPWQIRTNKMTDTNDVYTRRMHAGSIPILGRRYITCMVWEMHAGSTPILGKRYITCMVWGIHAGSISILGEEVYHMYGLRDTCRFYTNSRGGGISHVWFEGYM